MYAIGLDIGGTKITGAIVGVNGAVHRLERLPTPATDLVAFKAALLGLITMLTRDFDSPVTCIGIGAPGIVDFAGNFKFGGGTLTFLKDVNLIEVVRRQFSLPVAVANDHNCFALAEAIFGAGHGYPVMVGVIWGTGIGGGLIINSKIFSGAHGGAGEFGHMVMAPDFKDTCGCGQRGCLEQLASGAAISRRYLEMGGKIGNAGPREIYYSDEPAAKAALETAVHFLGRGLAILIQTFDPGVIVLGGGVSQLPDPIYDKLRQVTREFVMPAFKDKVNIVRHEVGNDAGVIGAAALAFEALNRGVDE